MHAVRTRTRAAGRRRHRRARHGSCGTHPHALETRVSGHCGVLLVAGESVWRSARRRASCERCAGASAMLEVAGVGGARGSAAGMRVLVDTRARRHHGLRRNASARSGRLLRAYRRLVRVLDAERPAPGRADRLSRSSTCAWPARPSGAAFRSSTSSLRRCGPGGAVACAPSPSASTSSASSSRSRPGLYNNGRPLAEFIRPSAARRRARRPVPPAETRAALRASTPERVRCSRCCRQPQERSALSLLARCAMPRVPAGAAKAGSR